MDSDTILRLFEIQPNGGELAPVKIVNEDGKLWMWDGYHTHEAAVQANVEKIRAEVERGTRGDACIKSLGANDKHGLPRLFLICVMPTIMAYQIHSVAYSLLNEDSKHTFRSLAKWIGASHPTISTRWNLHHLPLILAEVDNEVRGHPPVGVSGETWLDIVAEDHHAPGWFVKQRKLDLEAKAELEPKPYMNNNPDEPLGTQITSEQTTEASEENEQVEVTFEPPESGSRKGSVTDNEPQEETQATISSDFNFVQITDNSQQPERLRAYLAERSLAPITKSNLMEIIAGANKFGIHAYIPPRIDTTLGQK